MPLESWSKRKVGDTKLDQTNPSGDTPRNPADVLEEQHSRAEGLNAAEVKERLTRFGPNALPE